MRFRDSIRILLSSRRLSVPCMRRRRSSHSVPAADAGIPGPLGLSLRARYFLSGARAKTQACHMPLTVSTSHAVLRYVVTCSCAVLFYVLCLSALRHIAPIQIPLQCAVSCFAISYPYFVRLHAAIMPPSTSCQTDSTLQNETIFCHVPIW